MISNEDNLRINVLLRQDVHAIRIDESKMIVYALTGRGEGKVVLNPTIRDEKYLREIRELLSNHYLGSPGGYPVYIHRWTRMSQSRSTVSLEKLLKLGEPEAVVAVANADSVSAEVARRVWWAVPSEETARALLRQAAVVRGALGQELAKFLYEFLPFEAEPARVVENVRLLLQPGLLNEEERMSLWKKAAHKSVYYPGFLMAMPDEIPLDSAAHAHYPALKSSLNGLIEHGNAAAILYLKLHSAEGQGFLQCIRLALKRPSSQDVVVALFMAVGQYFNDLGLSETRQRGMKDIEDLNCRLCRSEVLAGYESLCEQLADVMQIEGVQKAKLEAMFGLAQLGESVLDPLFGGTDTLGSAMRKHIKPLTVPILAMLDTLEQP
ncbi:MAG TPA: hypothetical protein DDW55_14415 [Gammaproteobacteria bacterium]|nr:hypothetical protein [Gammaproteobacteria bacterium]